MSMSYAPVDGSECIHPSIHPCICPSVHLSICCIPPQSDASPGRLTRQTDCAPCARAVSCHLDSPEMELYLPFASLSLSRSVPVRAPSFLPSFPLLAPLLLSFHRTPLLFIALHSPLFFPSPRHHRPCWLPLFSLLLLTPRTESLLFPDSV